MPEKIIDGKRYTVLGGYFSSRARAERLAKSTKRLNLDLKYRIIETKSKFEAPKFEVFIQKETLKYYRSPQKRSKGTIHVRAHPRKRTKGVRAHTRKR